MEPQTWIFIESFKRLNANLLMIFKDIYKYHLKTLKKKLSPQSVFLSNFESLNVDFLEIVLGFI